MKKTSIVFAIFASLMINLNPVYAAGAQGKVDVLAGGYPDGAIAFSLVDSQINPAGCSSDAVFVVVDNATGAEQDAMALLMFAKSSGYEVWVSVREDVCHHPAGNDIADTVEFPVVQRVVVKS